MSRFSRSKVPPDVAALQERTASAFADLERDPEKDFSDVTVPLNSNGRAFDAGVDREINHLLGRKPIGWRISDIDGGPASIWRTAAFSATFLTLQSNANVTTCTVRVW